LFLLYMGIIVLLLHVSGNDILRTYIFVLSPKLAKACTVPSEVCPC
jgi:hypothetical protein